MSYALILHNKVDLTLEILPLSELTSSTGHTKMELQEARLIAVGDLRNMQALAKFAKDGGNILNSRNVHARLKWQKREFERLDLATARLCA